MTFLQRLSTCPLPHDRAKGAEFAARFGDFGPEFADLVRGMTGCSPYLAGLLEREETWLRGVLDQPPEAVAEAILGALDPALHPQGTDDDLGRSLRQAKRRMALYSGLCDLGGVWPLEAVTGALTALADRAVSVCLSSLVAGEQARGKLPPVAPRDGASDGPRDGGLFALAMGKMGAGELNYSSDIDLIVLFDEALYPGEAYADVRRVLIRVVQRMMRLLSDVTADGYVFRTDLRLRPDPSVTPVVIGMGAAERYYESQGRTWERAAMIKARVCAGDLQAGARFLGDIAPFIWRRHLDFATIEEAHAMRLRIRAHKNLGGPIQLPGHDVKLGRGGIRDIEFFTQTRQLTCGGRDPDLRGRATKPALAALAEKGWIGRDMAADLSGQYTRHRLLEHRIQMIEDAQTHVCPTTPDGLARLAAFSGEADPAAFVAREQARFIAVEAVTEPFFAPPEAEAEAASVWAAFPDPARVDETVRGWQGLPALRSDRARAIFERLAPGLAERLLGAAQPETALAQFDRFLRGLPAGVQVFSLFEANPRILDLLVDICATSPRLAEYMGRNAQVLDAMLSSDFFARLGSADALTADLEAVCAEAGDYEAMLDRARIWSREMRFRAGVQLLRGIASPEEAAADFSALAVATVRALLPGVTQEVARRHGPPPGAGAAVVAMGKLGSGEMTAASDLDLIVIYDAPPDAMSQGRKALAPPAYYARLTQTLILALTVPTAEGTLYEVDMRLRPSGRQGPVATGLASFAAYQKQEAWTWERLALTRARVIAGPPDLVCRVEAAIGAALSAPAEPARIRADMRDMRARIAGAAGAAARDPFEVKQGAGRMLDIELVLQAGRVLTPQVTARAPRGMIPGLIGAGYLDAGQGADLARALTRLATIQQITRLALGEGFDPARAGPGLTALVCRMTGARDLDDLAALLAADRDAAIAVVAGLLEG